MNIYLKVISFSFIIVVLAAGCASNATSTAQKAQQQTAAEERVYEVFGMDCPACHGGLTKLVNSIDGVAASKANWEEKVLIVHIASEATVSDEQIVDAIERANFTAGKRLK